MYGLVNQLIHFSKGAFSDCFVPWLHCFNPQVTIKVKNNPFFLITQTPFIIIIITFLLPQFPILSNPPPRTPFTWVTGRFSIRGTFLDPDSGMDVEWNIACFVCGV